MGNNKNALRKSSYHKSQQIFKLLQCLFLIAIPLLGCDVAPSSVAVSTPLDQSTATVIATQLPVSLLTNTSLPAPKPQIPLTPVISPSGAPTIPPDVVRYKCLEVAASIPAGQSLQGAIIFSNDDGSYLWDVQTGEKSFYFQHNGFNAYDIDISPDRKRVLFLNDAQRIMGVDGRVIWSMSSQLTIYSWLNSDQVWGAIFSAEKTAYVIVLNPLTGERQELHQDTYPNNLFASRYDKPKWDFLGVPIYDPTLSRAVYPECPPGCMKLTDKTIVLWDVKNKRILARLTTKDYFGNTPVWSQDGKQFVIAFDSHFIKTLDTLDQRDEFYLVTRDGLVRQMTRFADYFKFLEIPNSYKFSPDGQKVAFWMVSRPEPNDAGYLSILNTESGQVTNYCIKGLTVERADSLSAPIWSPDSSQLLVKYGDPNDPNRTGTIVVDIVRDYAAVIAENASPQGWMITSP